MASVASGERTEGGARTSRGTALGLLALGNTLWAGTYVAGKVALGHLSWVELNALRFSLATLLLAPVLIRGRHMIMRELSDRRSLWALARLILLGFVLNKAFEYAGLALSSASDVALLIATESLFTALLSWTVLKERVTRVGVAALVVGLAGVYLVVERGVTPNLGGPGGAGRIVGDLLVVVALLFEAGYTVSGKASLDRLPPLLITGVSIAGSLIVWLPAGAVAVARGGWPQVTPVELLAVLYMAAVATVIGYWMWFRALSALDASTAAPFLFIQPLLGAALAVWLLHETLTWATLAGAALIVGSLLAVAGEARRSSKAAGHAPPVTEPIP
ncbi:MAG TPA: DMT family transporter [Ktedonobacterales bacterium]